MIDPIETEIVKSYAHLTNQKNPVLGRKDDSEKAPLVQGCLNYFPLALNAVAMISKFGATKYKTSFAEKNWLHVDNGIARYTDACGRHLITDEVCDSDSNYLHAAHCAWDALARLELILRAGTALQGPPKATDQS